MQGYAALWGVWDPGVGGTNIEVNRTDRQGAQLSQECPLPANYQPTGTNNRTAQCRCLQCGRLFRLDPAVQVVSHHPRSFHSVGDLLQRKPAVERENATIWLSFQGTR